MICAMCLKTRKNCLTSGRVDHHRVGWVGGPLLERGGIDRDVGEAEACHDEGTG